MTELTYRPMFDNLLQFCDYSLYSPNHRLALGEPIVKPFLSLDMVLTLKDYDLISLKYDVSFVFFTWHVVDLIKIRFPC